MQSRNKKCGLILSAAAGLWAEGPAFAGYTFNTLATFNGTNGLYPSGDLILSGNTLYGTTEGGGASGASGDGTVFSVPVTGGTVTTLVSFNGTNGNDPFDGLTLSGNTLYGTTYDGGANNDGTVFSVPVTGGSPITLATFNNSNGEHPYAGLTLSGNTLYGTTYKGGASGDGTVFSVPVTGGTPTTLVTFNGSNGANPIAGLTLSGNTLYGTTNGGAASNDGTVFAVPVTGGSPTTLATFNNSNGDSFAGLTLSGNTLYGTTEDSGVYGYQDGTVFSVPVTGGALTTLVVFNGSNGSFPHSDLVFSGNTLYGTAEGGGASGAGTVFSAPVTGGSPTTLVTFNNSSGTNPIGGLTLAGSTFYGTTRAGAVNGYGSTVFSLTPNPILSLTAAAPTAFGSEVGTLTVTGSSGIYNVASATFAATPTGYLAVRGFNPSTDIEVYALEITDSVSGDLAADLSDAVSEINAGTYTGYSVTASTTDPLTNLNNGYDFYITITNDTLGTGSPYFGFDFTQLNGTSDTLSVAAAAVPEPASIGLLAVGGITLLGRRRTGTKRGRSLRRC
jgi:uncharacterized repeat protein (TIGR03803 family)